MPSDKPKKYAVLLRGAKSLLYVVDNWSGVADVNAELRNAKNMSGAWLTMTAGGAWITLNPDHVVAIVEAEKGIELDRLLREES